MAESNSKKCRNCSHPQRGKDKNIGHFGGNGPCKAMSGPTGFCGCRKFQEPEK